MTRAVKRARRKLRSTGTMLDAAKIASMRVPLWRRVLSRVWPRLYTDYVKAKFAEESRKNKAAIKTAAHQYAYDHRGKA